MSQAPGRRCPAWVPIARAAELAPGEVRGLSVAGREIALYRLEDGAYCATSNICTHEFARLSDGWLLGDTVECPLHGGRFDVRTGRALCEPAETALQTFGIRLQGDQVCIDLVPDDAG